MYRVFPSGWLDSGPAPTDQIPPSLCTYIQCLLWEITAVHTVPVRVEIGLQVNWQACSPLFIVICMLFAAFSLCVNVRDFVLSCLEPVSKLHVS